MDYESEMKEAMGRNRISAILPDGTPINLERERIQVAEMLFRPSLCPKLSNKYNFPPLLNSYQKNKTSDITAQAMNTDNSNKNFLGLQHIISQSITSCQSEIQEYMWNNIVLSGGNTNYNLFPDRLKLELDKLNDGAHSIKVVAPTTRDQNVWLGGAVMASLGDSFTENWIEKSEYEDIGSVVVHSKCQTSLLSR